MLSTSVIGGIVSYSCYVLHTLEIESRIQVDMSTYVFCICKFSKGNLDFILHWANERIMAKIRTSHHYVT